LAGYLSIKMTNKQTADAFMKILGYTRVTEIPTYEMDGDAIRKGFDDLRKWKDEQVRNIQKDSPR
jgi:hypothetical protein